MITKLWFYFIFYDFTLLLFFMSVNAQKKESTSNSQSNACNQLYQSEKDKWLKGEASPVPFALQLIAVFSYAPISFILQTNLILGDLYTSSPKLGINTNNGTYSKDYVEPIPSTTTTITTTTSTTITTTTANTPQSPLTTRLQSNRKMTHKFYYTPFSSYFDTTHFIQYWSQHHLQVITNQVYTSCFDFQNQTILGTQTRNSLNATMRMVTSASTSSSRKNPADNIAIVPLYQHEKIELKRIPDFQCYDNQEFNELLRKNKVKFPFNNHHLVVIQGKFKMIGLYKFWKNYDMLNYVYQSIKPAPLIKKFTNAVLNIFAKNFIAIHLRVDEEAFPSSLLPASIMKGLQLTGSSESPDVTGAGRILDAEAIISGNTKKTNEIMQYIKFSSCFKDLQHLDHELFIEPPILYVVTNARPNSEIDRRKIKFIIDELRSLGFENVYTRKRLIDKYIKKNNKMITNSASLSDLKGEPRAHDITEDLALSRTFTQEQFQYADILISKESACFIPSQLPTIVSYLIKRFMKLDKQVSESYDSINEKNYGNLASYREWGF